jgi:putative pyoverdin transport system ATP-binding/permease protein
MNFLDLLKAETKDVRNRLLSYMFLSGMSNAFILFVINGAAATVTYREVNTRLFLMFVVVITIYIVTQQYIFKRASYIVDQIIQKIRINLTDKIIQRAELIDLDAIGNSRIYNHMTHQTGEVSNSSNEITAAVQSLIMVVFSILYLGTLSIQALIVTVAVVAVGMIVYLGMEKKIIPFINKHNDSEIRLFSTLSHLLDGFKEIKLSHERGEDIRQDINNISIEARDNSITTKVMYSNAYIFAQTFFYVLIGIMVFILPRFFEIYTESVIQITAVILFIIGPLSSVVAGIPAYTRSNIAIQNIHKLELELDNLNTEPPTFSKTVHHTFSSFKELHFRSLEFHYYDRNKERSFSVGPVDFSIKKGETVFLVGGNGSGKSTLLKLVTGLYRPAKGEILIDGVPVRGSSMQEYRELYSAIFADFHLFEKLYGIRDYEPAMIDDLLREMRLSDKTAFENGQFTNINLSTGQKKRIAMIVSRLEDRQVYIFDEWAADQDPQFREYYYYELLPELKRAGKTVIVVSHDDSKYYATADRVYKMNMGQLTDTTEELR